MTCPPCNNNCDEGRTCGCTIQRLVRTLVARKPWVNLTDEEMLDCNMDGDFMVDRETAKLNVQAKLKDKNT